MSWRSCTIPTYETRPTLTQQACKPCTLIRSQLPNAKSDTEDHPLLKWFVPRRRPRALLASPLEPSLTQDMTSWLRSASDSGRVLEFRSRVHQKARLHKIVLVIIFRPLYYLLLTESLPRALRQSSPRSDVGTHGTSNVHTTNRYKDISPRNG